jgi:hypothetical protein
MNSLRVDALDLSVGALSATVDFFRVDVGCAADLVEMLFCLDDVLPVLLDDRDRPLFWATTVNGRRSRTAASATPMRLSISNLLSCWDYRDVKYDEARKS